MYQNKKNVKYALSYNKWYSFINEVGKILNYSTVYIIFILCYKIYYYAPYEFYSKNRNNKKEIYNLSIFYKFISVCQAYGLNLTLVHFQLSFDVAFLLYCSKVSFLPPFQFVAI